MDSDAQVWEKRSAKIVLGLRKGILIYGILVILLLFVYNIGFSEDVDKTMDGYILVENGESYPCEVRLTGQATEYPVKNFVRRRNNYRYAGDVTAYVNGTRLAIVSFDGSDAHYAYGENYPANCRIRRDLERVFAETELKKLLPEQDSKRCVIVGPAASEEEALALLENRERS